MIQCTNLPREIRAFQLLFGRSVSNRKSSLRLWLPKGRKAARHRWLSLMRLPPARQDGVITLRDDSDSGPVRPVNKSKIYFQFWWCLSWPQVSQPILQANTSIICVAGELCLRWFGRPYNFQRYIRRLFSAMVLFGCMNTLNIFRNLPILK